MSTESAGTMAFIAQRVDIFLQLAPSGFVGINRIFQITKLAFEFDVKVRAAEKDGGREGIVVTVVTFEPANAPTVAFMFSHGLFGQVAVLQRVKKLE